MGLTTGGPPQPYSYSDAILSNTRDFFTLEKSWKVHNICNVHINTSVIQIKIPPKRNEDLHVFFLQFSVFLSSQIWKYLFLRCCVLKSLKSRYSWNRDGRFKYHKSYELKKVVNDFFIFPHRFFKEFWKFISQMGNRLGVYKNNCKVKKVKHYYWGRFGLLQTHSF